MDTALSSTVSLQRGKRLLESVPTGLLIDGTWRPASDGGTFDVDGPATEDVPATPASAAGQDAVAALDAAAAAGFRPADDPGHGQTTRRSPGRVLVRGGRGEIPHLTAPTVLTAGRFDGVYSRLQSQPHCRLHHIVRILEGQFALRMICSIIERPELVRPTRRSEEC